MTTTASEDEDVDGRGRSRAPSRLMALGLWATVASCVYWAVGFIAVNGPDGGPAWDLLFPALLYSGPPVAVAGVALFITRRHDYVRRASLVAAALLLAWGLLTLLVGGGYLVLPVVVLVSAAVWEWREERAKTRPALEQHMDAPG